MTFIHRGRLRKVLGEPLVHFFLIGALIYAVYAFTGEPAADDQEKRVIITAGEITWLRDVWKKRAQCWSPSCRWGPSPWVTSGFAA